MGRHPDGKPKDYHVTHMWDIHEEALRLLAVGKRPKDIAAITGLTEQFISKLRNSPIAQERLAILGVARDVEATKTGAIIARVQSKAAQLLEEVVDGKRDANLGQQIDVAKDMLSRGGNSPVQRIKKDIQYGISKSALDAMKARNVEAIAIRDASYEVMED